MKKTILLPVLLSAISAWAGDLTVDNLTVSSDATIYNELIIMGPTTNATNAVATGGSVTTNGGYVIHTFTTNGSFTVSGGSLECDILVVAGGGAGGYNCGAGGGAGGLVYTNGVSVTGVVSIVVGAGGACAQASGVGSSGSNSSFGDLVTAIGGGGGGYSSASGLNGGSGGGGASFQGAGSGTAGQGHDGFDTGGCMSGGGGGAGADGGEDDGGAGLDYSSIFGSDVGDSGWFAGGGAGFYGDGGAGGGGDSTEAGYMGYPGQDGTGGGGAPWTGTLPAIGDGGSGIVIVRYNSGYDAAIRASDGTITVSAPAGDLPMGVYTNQ